MCTNKKHLYPHTVCVCKSKNIYLLTHCDEWVSHMCSAHIKLFLSSQRVCLCFTDMFEQKTFKPSQAKCIRVCVSQIFTGVYRCLEMFTRKKKTFISLSLCGRAEWRCLIIAWRQETGLCFAMKNTADDISLVVQRTIHNKIQIIADFAKTSQTRRWCWSFLAKLSKTQHTLGGTYFDQLASFTICIKTRFVCPFLMFYPHFLEACLPNWLPETWYILLRKPTNVPATQTLLRRSTVGQGLVMMLTMMMIKMVVMTMMMIKMMVLTMMMIKMMVMTMMTKSDLRKAAGLAPWTRLIFMNAFNWPVPRT